MRLAGTFKRSFDLSIFYQRQVVIAVILAVALLAFEMFNFDTTQYALRSLLGEAAFLSLPWATILAIAFCAIDFAGLVRFFSPGQVAAPSKEVWYLMGAWLLGATMNALMTWWAISLTLINHEFGNEVLSRGELLRIVPIFVALLVWLTRILFIGGLTLAGGHLLGLGGDDSLPLPVRNRRPGRPMARGERPSRPAPEAPAVPASARPARAERPRTSTPSRPARSQPPTRRAPERGRQRPPMPPIGQRLPLKADRRRHG